MSEALSRRMSVAMLVLTYFLTQDLDINNSIVVNQQYYIDTFPGATIVPERLQQPELQLTDGEVATCRSVLGALQWLAVQTQPQLVASRRATRGMAMVGEVRRDPQRLKFFKFPGVNHWQDVAFIANGQPGSKQRPKHVSGASLCQAPQPRCACSPGAAGSSKREALKFRLWWGPRAPTSR